MKDSTSTAHPETLVEYPSERTDTRAPPLDVNAIHAAHVDFVWRTLQRFGVRDADLEDALQEVFVVVFQRLHTYDPAVRVTTWLHGIARRVAIAWRRRAYIRRERTVEGLPEPRAAEEGNPESVASEREARARLAAILDTLDPDRRAVFVMFEIDGVPCDEIAALMGVPVGTVYSRLHAARKDFERALARWRARDPQGAAR